MPDVVRFLPVTYLKANAERDPDGIALYDLDRGVTFAELLAHVRRLALVLREGGLRDRDVVGVQLPNVWEYVALELAIPHAGGIILPLPPSLGRRELADVVQRSGMSYAVIGHGCGEDLATLAPSFSELRAVYPVEELFGLPLARARAREAGGEGVSDADEREGRTETELQSLQQPGRKRRYFVEKPDPDRIVEIALTSGTTGMPKLAALSAGLKQATFEAFTERLEIRSDDRILIMSPVTQGIGGMCLYCLRRGAALVMLHEPHFSPEHTLAVAERSRATFLVGVPTNLTRLLASNALGRTDLSALRATAVAGAPMPPEVCREWEEKTGARVVIFYGSMDAGQLSVGRPSDTAEHRWNSVGKPHDVAELRIVDADGNEVPPGQMGEICMRGPTVQERYWGEADSVQPSERAGRARQEPAPTMGEHPAEAPVPAGPYSSDGWAHMGDLGYLDVDGYLHIVGRIKDIIIRGGTNINPHEIETILQSHPAITEAAVVGRPDPDLGERAVAFVVSRDHHEIDLDNVRAFLSEQGVARYKWPEFVVTLPALPLSGPGKLNRRALRERARDLSEGD